MTLEELYRTNRDLYVKKYAIKTGSTHDSEDIIQEAFMRAWKYLQDGGQVNGELNLWFSSVLHNSWRDFMRDKRDGGLVREEYYKEEEEQSNIDLEQNRYLVMKLLEGKTGNQHEVLRLHYVLGYSPKEINKYVDIGSGAIRNYLSQFRKEVQEMFSQ